MGALRPFFVVRMGFLSAFFIGRKVMHQKILNMARAAIIAALYVVLTHFQNILLPGSASWAIQCRLSETLCILAFFTPAAIPGLTIGCLLFNITFAGALPLDWLVGSLATLIAAQMMWHLRDMKFHGLPLLGLTMPALTNAVLVGYELTLFIGGGFWINALYVAIGELIVLLIPGSLLYVTMKHRKLDALLFS